MIVYIAEVPFDILEASLVIGSPQLKRLGVFGSFGDAKRTITEYAEKEAGWDMSHPAWFNPKKIKRIENGKEVRTTLFQVDDRKEFFGQIESRIVERC